jgi:hypothetical protein
MITANSYHQMHPMTGTLMLLLPSCCSWEAYAHHHGMLLLLLLLQLITVSQQMMCSQKPVSSVLHRRLSIGSMHARPPMVISLQAGCHFWQKAQ